MGWAERTKEGQKRVSHRDTRVPLIDRPWGSSPWLAAIARPTHSSPGAPTAGCAHYRFACRKRETARVSASTHSRLVPCGPFVRSRAHEGHRPGVFTGGALAARLDGCRGRVSIGKLNYITTQPLQLSRRIAAGGENPADVLEAAVARSNATDPAAAHPAARVQCLPRSASSGRMRAAVRRCARPLRSRLREPRASCAKARRGTGHRQPRPVRSEGYDQRR